MRDTIVGFLPGMQGASDAWHKLAEVVPLAEAQVDPAARTRAIFDLARISHRGGFGVERDQFLGLLDTFDDAGIGGIEKRAEFVERVSEEHRLLEKARERFRRGIEKLEGTAEQRVYYQFLSGDLSRRLGDFDAARKALEAAELAASSSEKVRSYAKDVLKVIKVQARPNPLPSGPRASGDADGR